MKPSQTTQLLAELIRTKSPGLLVGAPGVGKTSLIEQAAKAAGATLLVSHPAVADPTDFKGLPWVAKNAKSAVFLPFGEFDLALNAKELLVWLLDDLGQASPAVQAACMQLLLARRVNDHVLPDCVTFLAATNRRIDRANVSGILEPVKSRFTTIVEVTADKDDFTNWAMDNGLPDILIAFIRFREDLLCKFEPSADLTNSPVPRTWANVGRIMEMELDDAVRHEAIVGAVGEGAAVEFGGFLKMFRELPNIDAIMIDPTSGKIPTAPAALYAIVTALGMRGNADNFDRLAIYAQRLMDDLKGDFAALLVRDCMRKDEEIVNTKGFVRLAAGPLGDLIQGQVRR